MRVLNGMRTVLGGGSPGRPRYAGTAGLLAVTVLALGLSVAGCAGSKAASGSPAGGTGGAPNAADEREAQLVRYSQCMRQNGVPGFPDPVDGRLQLRAQKGGELDPDNPRFQAAQKACKSMEPPGIAQQGQNPQQQEQMQQFVKCMRDNGVPRFPDPQPDGRIQIDPGTGVDLGSATFKAAQEKCRTLLPGGVAPGGP